MKVTEEMIRALQAKIDISYEEAERYLYKTNGDVDRAAFLYKDKQNSTGEKIRKGFKSCLKYRLRLFKGDKVILNFPLVALLLLFIIDSTGQRIAIIAIVAIIALITECEFKIEKEDEEDHVFRGANGTNKKTHNQAPKTNTSPVNNQVVEVHQVTKQAAKPVVKPREVVVKPEVAIESEQVLDKEPIIEVAVETDDLPTNSQQAVEEIVEESYNDKDNDDDDDYYEFVIED